MPQLCKSNSFLRVEGDSSRCSPERDLSEPRATCGPAELLLACERSNRVADTLCSAFQTELLLQVFVQQSCWTISSQVDSPSQCQLARCRNASNRYKAGCRARREKRMLWTVFAILLLLWLLGWGFHIAGSLIHLILVIALVVLLIEVTTGRRAAV
jgi:Family of unknown function (DUF5670)